MSIIVNRFELYSSPIHTKNNNYNSNYKDNDISVHTNGRYRLFILSARSSAALNSPACYGLVTFFTRAHIIKMAIRNIKKIYFKMFLDLSEDLWSH